MPFSIVRNDITHMQVDAIVNTANPKPVIGSGVDSGIHQKAGPRLLEARQKIGVIHPGDAAITPAFDLNANYVIHTVGPVWRDGTQQEEALLRSCYERSLALARKHRCQSVAFPLISTGNYGFPKDKALRIAMAAISDFLMKHEMQIYLVVFDREAFQLSGKLFSGVSSFIDENYIQQATLKQCSYADNRDSRQEMRLPEQQRRRQATYVEMDCLDAAPCAPMSAPAKKESKPGLTLPFTKPKAGLAKPSFETDAGFSETLLKLIDRTGKKDSEIYKKANVSKQHFSKIRNNPDYKPTKATAIAFAIALELDMAQTRDLIGRAGYALTRSSKFDVIIMYFIQEGNYNMFDINATLFEFDQSLLGV